MTAMYAADIRHQILAKWLYDTTCYNYWIGRSVLFENDDYIVLKHNSHASYCGRFYDNLACRAYAELYRKADLSLDAKGYNKNLFTGNGSLARWDGRIARSRVLADCQQMHVQFTNKEKTNRHG